jgi:mRNA interferase RelE/StbE
VNCIICKLKIKLRNGGYRLVYKVEDHIVTVSVIAVGKRERNRVYIQAQERQDDLAD